MSRHPLVRHGLGRMLRAWRVCVRGWRPRESRCSFLSSNCRLKTSSHGSEMVEYVVGSPLWAPRPAALDSEYTVIRAIFFPFKLAS